MVRARAKHISYEFDEQYTPMINEANSKLHTNDLYTTLYIINTLARCHSYYHGLQSDSSGPWIIVQPDRKHRLLGTRLQRCRSLPSVALWSFFNGGKVSENRIRYELLLRECECGWRRSEIGWQTNSTSRGARF